jgi:hypothetical protein
MGLLLKVVASAGVDLAAVAYEVLPRAGLKADRVEALGVSCLTFRAAFDRLDWRRSPSSWISAADT